MQANFGTRRHLTVLGRNIGADPDLPPMITKTKDTDLSSLIVIIATDAPFLPPQSRRGRRNEPALVVETLTRLAEVRDLSLEPPDLEDVIRRIYRGEAGEPAPGVS